MLIYFNQLCEIGIFHSESSESNWTNDCSKLVCESSIFHSESFESVEQRTILETKSEGKYSLKRFSDQI